MCQVPFHNERKQIASTLHTMVTSQAREQLLKGGVSKQPPGKLPHEILCTPPQPQGSCPNPVSIRGKFGLTPPGTLLFPQQPEEKSSSDFKILPGD